MKGIVLQQFSGSTLVVVLLLLLSVSLLGVSSLKTGLFNQRMTENSQSDAYALQAAESAINGVLIEAQGSVADEAFFETVMRSGEQINCIANNGVVRGHGYCTRGDTFGRSSSGVSQRDASQTGASLGELQSYAITKRKGRLPVDGYDVDQFSFHVFDTTGVGSYTGSISRYAYANTQQWKRFGVSPGFDNFLPN